MALLSLQEATSLMHSYGIKCDVPQVKKWLMEGKIKGTIQGEKYFVAEDEVHTYLHWYRWAGTAYEEGIDDQTKIERLLEEARELQLENKRLKDEITVLKCQLEEIPF